MATTAPKPAFSTASDNMSTRQLLATTVRLGAPSVIENFLGSMIIMTDALMLARLVPNTPFLAATAITSICFWRIVTFFGCTQTGAGAYVARRWGEGRFAEAGRAVGHSLAFAFVVGIAGAAAMWFIAPPLFAKMGAKDEVLRISVSFFRILLLVLPVRLALLNMTACMRAAGDTRTPLLLMSMMFVLNIVFNYALIFGNWGFPRMEMDGSAIASALSFVIGTALGGILLFRGLQPRRLIAANAGQPIAYEQRLDEEEAPSPLVTVPRDAHGTLRLNFGMLRPWLPEATPTILRVSVPTLGEELLYSISFMTYLGMIGRFGEDVLAAHSTTVRIESLSFTIGWGVAVATGAMVGQALGAGQVRLARRLFAFSAKFSMIVMGFIGALFLAFPDAFLWPFGLEGPALDVGRNILRVLAFAQIPMAAAMCMQGGLRGAGDTVSTFLTPFAGVLAVRLGIGYLITWPLGMGVMGIYFATALDWLTRAAFLWWFVASGRWERIRV